MEQDIQKTHISIGKEQYEIKHHEIGNLSTQDTKITTKIISPEGVLYRLVPVNDIYPNGQTVTTGYMEAHAVGGKGVMKHGKRVVKFFMVGGILEHVGYFE